MNPGALATVVNPPSNLQGAIPRPNIQIFNPGFKIGLSGRFPISRELFGQKITLTGLTGMRSAHIFALEAGCEFGGSMQRPIQGILSRTRTSRGIIVHSSERMGNDDWDRKRASESNPAPYRFKIPQRSGYPVKPDGTVELSLFGWANVDVTETEFNNDMIGGTVENPGSGWVKYMFDATPLESGNDAGETCTPRAIIAVEGQGNIWRLQDEAGNWRAASDVTRPKLTEGQPWFSQGTRNVTITDTWRLGEKLKAEMRTHNQLSFSQCAGISDNFHGKFPVGMVNRGGKLAFVVRSGQIPTDCFFSLGPNDLPPGVGISGMTFRLQKVGDKCGPTRGSWGRNLTDLAQTFLFPPGEEWFMPIAYAYSEGGIGMLPRIYDSRAMHVLPGVRLWPLAGTTDIPTFGVNNPSVHAIGNPYALAQGQSGNEGRDVLRPLLGLLSCDMAGSNDHEAAIILDSLTVNIPAGTTF